MNKDYKMIALDMDGTLLNSRLEISLENQEAIEKVCFSCKKVVIATGRALNEIEPYLKYIPKIQYLILENGAVVYDYQNHHILNQNVFKRKEILYIREVYHKQDIMLHVFVDGQSYVQKSFVEHINEYLSPRYKNLFENIVHHVDDIDKFILQHLDHIEKINFFHHSVNEKNQSISKLQNLDIMKLEVEKNSIEMTPLGVHKGNGITQLCKIINIATNQVIAVGDSENDISMFDVAGLSVAMGNSSEEIQNKVDFVTSHHDQNGVKEVIEKFLI